ncbi:DUF2786 domain-containing protein [Listeria fleischmannii]|uniref:Uncharacterized protein n=1 Tax=Listeria fleischmannii FSL S10-1203 TaxID=1265822 RepID=W7DM78_9LIST|nr:DUF2786 domain-containing protein [Listeria fleischmannii]EUJ56435.1 hypothetical protein MCOL2_08971 [Listeria fleischmannii FSL S10-1203]
MPESILRKIQKLFDLANDADDEEAKTAILRARELMVKHNISEEQIKSNSRQKPSSVEDVQIRTVIFARVQKWTYRLMISIAYHFRCEPCFSHSSNKTNLMIYGLEEDLNIAEATFHYAFAIIKRRSKVYREKMKILDSQIVLSDLNNAVKSYIEGFVDGIRYALNEQYEEFEASGYELAVITPKVVKEYGKNNTREVRKKLDTNIENHHSYSDGFTDGKDFLNKKAIGEEAI